MIRPSLTVVLAMTAFSNRSTDLVNVTPDTVTRFAFQNDGNGNFTQVEISNQTGPQNDGKVEVIDAIYFTADEIDVSGVDRALIVRMQTTDLTDGDIQAIGQALEAYMDLARCEQFATAAIHVIGKGQELFGHWNTMVFTRDNGGKWSAKNLGFTSVTKASNGSYGILRNGQMVKVKDKMVISSLLDDQKLAQLLEDGYKLQGTTKAHLVRPPIGKTFAVIAGGQQIVFDVDFKITGTSEVKFTTMQAIDVDGTPIDGKVTTVSGSGNNWDVRRAIPAAKADGLAQAYGAQAA